MTIQEQLNALKVLAEVTPKNLELAKNCIFF